MEKETGEKKLNELLNTLNWSEQDLGALRLTLSEVALKTTASTGTVISCAELIANDCKNTSTSIDNHHLNALLKKFISEATTAGVSPVGYIESMLSNCKQ